MTTLPETSKRHLKMDGWKVFIILSLWGKRPIFQGQKALSFREKFDGCNSSCRRLGWLKRTRNPNDPCFDWKRPRFGGLFCLQNRGHLHSRFQECLFLSIGACQIFAHQQLFFHAEILRKFEAQCAARQWEEIHF